VAAARRPGHPHLVLQVESILVSKRRPAPSTAIA